MNIGYSRLYIRTALSFDIYCYFIFSISVIEAVYFQFLFIREVISIYIILYFLITGVHYFIIINVHIFTFVVIMHFIYNA